MISYIVTELITLQQYFLELSTPIRKSDFKLVFNWWIIAQNIAKMLLENTEEWSNTVIQSLWNQYMMEEL